MNRSIGSSFGIESESLPTYDSHRAQIRFGPLVLSAAVLSDLAVLPEFSQVDCTDAMLALAEQRMVRDGVSLGVVKTSNPRLFAERGWAVCGRYSFSSGNTRSVLSHLRELRSHDVPTIEDRLLHRKVKPIHIRLWRHVEQAALMRLYDHNVAETYGATIRSNPYWRWLVGRGGVDRIYIAIEGPRKLELDDTFAPVVGYAAMRGGRVVETMVTPDRTDVSLELLARSCSDAIERDNHAVRVDAAPGDALHDILRQAGGEYYCTESVPDEKVCMMKLLYPLETLQELAPVLCRRAHDANIDLPLDITLIVGNDSFRMTLTDEALHIQQTKPGRRSFTCTTQRLTQMLLGHIDVAQAISAVKVEVSSAATGRLLQTLFPSIPFWLPPWDDLSAP